MSKQNELFDFLAELIAVQIKKYVELATRGVGPDARLNAALVYDEVDELLEMAELLLEEITFNDNSPEEQKDIVFTSVFGQIKFYLEQESLRGYAGWLLDANNIHTGVYTRTQKQLQDLFKIANIASAEAIPLSEPTTDIQQQCKHDSNGIALRILALAIDIKNNPNMELDAKVPSHAQTLLRKNATTRYVTYETKINALHSECKNFINISTMQERSSTLKSTKAKENEQIHNSKLALLLNRYQKLEPTSSLFSTDHEWFKIPEFKSNSRSAEQSASYFSRRNFIFIGGIVLTGVCLITQLLPYFMQQEEEGASLKLL